MRKSKIKISILYSLMALTTWSISSSQLHADPVNSDLYKVLKGSVMGVISDGDFAWSTYVNKKLAPQDGRTDTLRIISLKGEKAVFGDVAVSNSVVATPETFVLSPDGKYAFVIERLGQRKGNEKTISDLSAGNRLFIVDIQNREAPAVIQSVKLQNAPESVRVSPNGAYLAIPSNTPEGAFVQIVPFANGKAGSVFTFNLADTGIPVEKNKPRGGITASFIDWHPSGKAISVNLNTRNQVAFFKVDSADPKLKLVPWGEAIEVGPDPFVGRFTPDGKHYVTSNWGRVFSAKTVEGRLPQKKSTVSSVRLGELSDGKKAKHNVVSQAQSDRSAEGIAVDPRGEFVVTLNMRETILRGSKRFTRQASISLLSFDSATGKLVNLGNTLFDGILPEGTSFDATGDHLLVSVYAYHPDQGRKQSGLEVYKLLRGKTPKLKHLGWIPTLPGTHHVDVVK